MEIGNRLSQGGSGKGRQKKRTPCQFQRMGEKSLGRGFHPGVVACTPSAYLCIWKAVNLQLWVPTASPQLSRHSTCPRGNVNLPRRWCCEPLGGLSAAIPVLLKRICSLALTFTALRLLPGTLKNEVSCRNTLCNNEKWGDSSLIYPEYSPQNCMQGVGAVSVWTGHLRTLKGSINHWAHAPCLLASDAHTTVPHKWWHCYPVEPGLKGATWLSICHHGAGRQSNFLMFKGCQIQASFHHF